MIIAGIQMDVALGQPAENLRRIGDWFRQAREQRADLVLFPECSVTGYCFSSRQEAAEFAEPAEGKTLEALRSLCRSSGGKILAGFLERQNDAIFNSAMLVGEAGLIAVYRKVHLPYLGVDRFVDFGREPFAVQEVDGVRIGINICYDSGFPESSRTLALAGADLILLPTNWPTGAEILAENAIPTRAMENGVFYAAINRVGVERGIRFIGRSSICDLSGRVLARGSIDQEEMLLAEIEPQRARVKTVVRVPGEQMIDRLADRRPEFYSHLTEPTNRLRPGRDLPASDFR